MPYSIDQVRAVVAAASTPLSTAKIAEAVYASLRDVEGDRGYGTAAEVSSALARMRAAGEVLSAMYGDGSPHECIAYNPDRPRERFYARPDLLDAWRAEVHRRVAAQNAVADAAADVISEWSGPGTAPDVEVTYDGDTGVTSWSMRGGREQLTYLAAALASAASWQQARSGALSRAVGAIVG